MASIVAQWLGRTVEWVCVAVLYVTFGAIFAILCTDVALRYFSGSSLRWASEIPELLFPWLVMAGVVLAARHGAHIATTFLADPLQGRARRVLMVVGHVAVIFAYSVLAFVTAKAIPMVADEHSPLLQVPGSVTYICLLAGFVLVVLVHVAEVLHWSKAPARHEVVGAYQ